MIELSYKDFVYKDFVLSLHAASTKSLFTSGYDKAYTYRLQYSESSTSDKNHIATKRNIKKTATFVFN